ncbi:uncharacterized protein LOC114348237 [Diabrotica virgifera virgifera]|uniref:Uncharacterized protein LOC114348237 isoform X2 n=1 Tax=Diabrotica virgifera virgifera TaxID=50390 RepID=A0A6P7HG02_DIAVI|nr:uncharacterized protein LOC114348237 [Diabrotica virgifera virgifera]
MLSRLTLLTLFISLAAAATVRPTYDVYGNYKTDEYHKYTSDCCRVPNCDEFGRCYDSIECGHICSTANYPKAQVNRTPGYHKKSSYTKYDCHFGECNHYQFTCDHCPDPAQYDFSIYTVRKDCMSCYA